MGTTETKCGDASKRMKFHGVGLNNQNAQNQCCLHAKAREKERTDVIIPTSIP